jgi:predicted lipoprotein with Yx(FWY)xxD motif
MFTRLMHRTATERATLTRRAVLGTGLAAAALVVAACGNSSGSSGGSTAGAAASPSIASPTGNSIGTAGTALGTILVDGNGRTVYQFAADKPGVSNCSGTCLQYWHAVTTTGMPKAASGVTAKLGTITRSDGTKQVTADGWPLYTYVGDSSEGQTAGQGTNLSGGLWWVVSTSGAAVKAAPSSSAKPSTSSSSGGGGGWA